MAWTTLLDEFNLTGAIPDYLEIVEVAPGNPIPTMPIVRCRSYRGKSCNRKVAADCMYKVDGIYICDGCIQVIRRKEGKTRGEMVARVGGPRWKDDLPKPTRGYKGGRFASD